MLDLLYLEAKKKKDSLNQNLLNLEHDNEILDNWENLNIHESYKDFSIGAGDGSFNKKKFLNFNFYAVASESLIFDGELKKIPDGDIGNIPHYSHLDELLRGYMGLYELRSCYKSIDEYNVDYYLYDGSLFGDLIRPFSNKSNISKFKRDEIIDASLDYLINNLMEYKPIDLIDKVIKLYFKSNISFLDYKMFLINITKLIFLEKILQNKEKIIAISKTSTNNEIFSSEVPDIAIFDKYTNMEGISTLSYKKLSNEEKHSFPIYNNFFKNLEFTIFYLRLDYGTNVLKIELPYKATIDQVYDIIEKIKKFSTDGYPYLLKKAHKDVVISNNNISELINIIELKNNTGREMLN